VDDGVTVVFVAAEATWPLRRQVLRPTRSLPECAYPGDDDPRAAHAAAVSSPVAPGTDPRTARDAKTAIVAVGTVIPEAAPFDPDRTDAWRIRGMATAAAARHGGLGTAVLDLLVDHVGRCGGGLLWCHARTPALGLYRRAGFRPRGEVFELPEIGPHQVMWRTVAPAAPGAARSQ